MAMLANVHMVSHVDDDDDDLYSGFGTEEVAPALQTEDLEFDEGFQVSAVLAVAKPPNSRSMGVLEMGV